MSKPIINIGKVHYTPVHDIKESDKLDIIDKPRVDKPVGIKQYYKEFIAKWTALKAAREKTVQNTKSLLDNLYKEVKLNIDYYKEIGIDLKSFEEFKANKYIHGTLYREVFAKVLVQSNLNDAKVVLGNYVEAMKAVRKAEHEYEECDKYLALRLKDFTDICWKFYTEVHKLMIINGYGYVFEGRLGWTCINRVSRAILKNKHRKIDYAKTKAKKAEILARGGKLWNKEEAEWCKERGIEYKGEDYRVFANPEYYYEFPIISSTIPNSGFVDYAPTDFRHSSIRGKSNNDLLKETNGNLKAICELRVDYKTKLMIALDADKLLYSNFIRNENQESVYHTTSSRKD